MLSFSNDSRVFGGSRYSLHVPHHGTISTTQVAESAPSYAGCSVQRRHQLWTSASYLVWVLLYAVFAIGYRLAQDTLVYPPFVARCLQEVLK